MLCWSVCGIVWGKLVNLPNLGHNHPSRCCAEAGISERGEADSFYRGSGIEAVLQTQTCVLTSPVSLGEEERLPEGRKDGRKRDAEAEGPRCFSPHVDKLCGHGMVLASLVPRLARYRTTHSQPWSYCPFLIEETD